MTTLNQLFLESAISYPDRVAVIFDNGDVIQTLEYSKLLSFSNTIAGLLQSNVNESKIIGLVWHTDILLPAGILGILQLPAAFASVDLGENAQVNESFFARLHIKYVLSNLPAEKLIAAIGPSASSVHILKTEIINRVPIHVYEIICVGKGPPDVVQLAYVMQTSGTTGQSKIVKVPHQCIVPNIIHLRTIFNLNPEDCVLMCSPLTFDPSIVELFLTLSSGASILLVPTVIKMIPQKLLNIIHHRNKVSILQATPTLIKRFSSSILQSTLLSAMSALRVLAFGGECCPSIETIQSWRQKGNNTQFYNLYGITEVSCWALWHHITEQELCGKQDSILLGELLDGTQLTVQDDEGNVINCGEGELYIGGRNRFCFIDDEECHFPAGTVMRASGDIVKLKEDGTLVYTRRKDDQIKRYGKRVNLRQIEEVLQNLEEVECGCVVDYNGKLLIFIVPISFHGNISEHNIIQLMKNKLPSYAIPDGVHFISSLPVTSHGKVNKKLLIKLFQEQLSDEISLEKSSSVQKILLNYWKEYFSDFPMHLEDTFIQLGGDSLQAVRLAERLELILNKPLPNLIDKLLNEPLKLVIDYVERYPEDEKSETGPEVLSEGSKRKFEMETNIPCKKVIKKFQSDCFLTLQRGNKYRLQCCCSTSSCFTLVSLSNTKFLHPGGLMLNILWTYNTNKCVDASPVLLHQNSEDLVFIGSHSHLFAAIDLKTGQERWKSMLGERIEASAIISSCGKVIIVGCYDGYIYFMDVKTGHILWKFDTDGPVKCSACAVPSTSLVIVGSHSQHLYALDYQAKSCNWKTHLGGGSVFSSPIVSQDDQVIFAATLRGFITAIQVSSGDILWQFDVGKPVFSSPNLTDVGLVVGCVDGRIYCLDFSGNLLWSFSSKGPIFSSPCICNQKIFIGSHDDHVYSLSSDGIVLWTKKMNSHVYATPFATSQQNSDAVIVVCSTVGKISCLNYDTGKELLSFDLHGEIFSSPIVFQDSIVVGCRDNNVYCLQLTPET